MQEIDKSTEASKTFNCNESEDLSNLPQVSLTVSLETPGLRTLTTIASVIVDMPPIFLY